VHKSRLEDYKKEFERQQKKLKDFRKTGKIGKGELEQADIRMVLGKGGKGGNKEMKDFGGSGGAEDDVEQLMLLEELKELRMHISFQVRARHGPLRVSAHVPWGGRGARYTRRGGRERCHAGGSCSVVVAAQWAVLDRCAVVRCGA
jgi:hypothetical protein